MKILITGANGMVARATIKHCESIGDQVVAVTRQEMNIADAAQIAAIFESEKPKAIINCAAYTNVDGAETSVEASWQANVVGVENLALACKKIDAAFVTISTDYIFDGANRDFYTQRDTPNPIRAFMANRNSKAKLGREMLMRVRLLCVQAGFTARTARIFCA